MAALLYSRTAGPARTGGSGGGFLPLAPAAGRHACLRRGRSGDGPGVNLFFVLSGFLITSILLESRGKPHYFRNFYGRRALRIWPVYVLTLAICYLKADWFIHEPVSLAIRTAPWWAYIFFVQNLFHLNLPPGIGPTWSLAIEEQYYFLWAPLVRFLKKPWMMAGVLGAALVVSPIFRMTHFAWITPTDTVTHLDGIAMGSLIALGLHTLPLSRRAWLLLGGCGIVTGILAGRNQSRPVLRFSIRL